MNMKYMPTLGEVILLILPFFAEIEVASGATTDFNRFMADPNGKYLFHAFRFENPSGGFKNYWNNGSPAYLSMRKGDNYAGAQPALTNCQSMSNACTGKDGKVTGKYEVWEYQGVYDRTNRDSTGYGYNHKYSLMKNYGSGLCLTVGYAERIRPRQWFLTQEGCAPQGDLKNNRGSLANRQIWYHDNGFLYTFEFQKPGCLALCQSVYGFYPCIGNCTGVDQTKSDGASWYAEIVK